MINERTRAFIIRIAIGRLTAMLLSLAVAQDQEAAVQPTPEGFDKFLV